ncbi:hypothetical protein [Bacillus alveayuensis]|uniref:hypothetical protein n=1 Tax=Aeribacillus alveayuensis TaxID=279215 RepID=UPI0005D0F78D|nr:hypothetical protein [Bacillus alveayuensis]
MNTWNLVVFLWQVSFVLSVITFLHGFYKKSWISMFISAITFLPAAYYFYGANNSFRFIAFIPIILLLWTLLLKKTNGKK